jgi:hypothetical protein
MFYPLGPQTVFATVAQFWDESLKLGDIHSLPWTHQHALMLALAAILKKPTHRTVYDFITKDLETRHRIPLLYYIASGIAAPYRIIQDTSLYVLSLCLKTYNVPSGHPEVQQVIQLMAQLMETRPSPIMVTRIFGVVNAFLSSQDTQFLPTWFASLERFAISGVERPDALSTPIYNQSHLILGTMIRQSPDSLLPRVGSILERTLIQLSESCQAVPNDNIFTIQQQKLHVITVCFMRFGDQFAEFGIRTAQLIFRLMQNLHAQIWEDALVSLILVVSHCKHAAAEIWSQDRVNRLVETALQSESPAIITNTVMALAKFYESLLNGARVEDGPASELLQKLPASFALIVSCLEDARFTRGFSSTLLVALADIISAAAQWITPEMRERLFNIYWKAWSEISVSGDMDDIARRKEDIMHANQMFTAVFKGFTAILETYAPNDPLISDHKVMRSYMINPPPAFLRLGSFTPASLTAFCEFLKQYNNVYQRKGNILLNRIANFQLLVHAKALGSPRLEQLAKETLVMVSKA